MLGSTPLLSINSNMLTFSNNSNGALTNEKDDTPINLNVAPIKQEKNNYCVVAVIQMIWNYLGVDHSLPIYSQDNIFLSLNGTSEGIETNQNTADFINSQIPVTSIDQYTCNTLPQGFGQDLDQLTSFQNYISISLTNNRPALFAYDYQEQGEFFWTYNFNRWFWIWS